jgi:hypothetical protein
LLDWSFAELLAVFLVETTWMAGLAPLQFRPARSFWGHLRIPAWHLGWGVILLVFVYAGMGVSTVAEMERYRGVDDSPWAMLRVLTTGSPEQEPSWRQMAFHPLALTTVASLVAVLLGLTRTSEGFARSLVHECWLRAGYLLVGIVYAGIALFVVMAFAPEWGALFLTLPLVAFKILLDGWMSRPEAQHPEGTDAAASLNR